MELGGILICYYSQLEPVMVVLESLDEFATLRHYPGEFAVLKSIDLQLGCLSRSDQHHVVFAQINPGFHFVKVGDDHYLCADVLHRA